jgi:hypothetical protein
MEEHTLESIIFQENLSGESGLSLNCKMMCRKCPVYGNFMDNQTNRQHPISRLNPMLLLTPNFYAIDKVLTKV